ncbi:hypothetical protein [Singulisphaera sp. PoT]|uniref:hypothetical protein n=1 Tax=Singulisphaera sp. PoT TaxID=3411797 RepID=UPI003BF4EA87
MSGNELNSPVESLDSPPRTTWPQAEVSSSLDPRPRSLALMGLVMIVAGAAAGLASWRVGEWAQAYFAPTFEMSKELSSNAVSSAQEIGRQKRLAVQQVASAAYGSMGAVLGLLLGACGSPWRGGLRRVIAAMAGAVLGGTLCWLCTRLMLGIYWRAFMESATHLSHDVLFPILIHGGMWAGAGLGAGLAFGLGGEGWKSPAIAALGGIVGAILGTLVFDVLGGIAFPLASTTNPIPATANARLLVHMSVCLMSAVGILWATRPSPAKSPGGVATSAAV